MKRKRRTKKGRFTRRARAYARVAAAPRRRRRGSGGKIGLTGAGLKRAFDLKSIAVGLAGALGARALYGLLVDKAPDLDDRARAAIGAVGPALAGIAASGAPSIVFPLAIGGVGIALADLFADQVAEAAGESVPLSVRDGLSLGVGYAGKEAAPVPSQPLLSQAAMEASLQVSPPPVGVIPEETGVGQVNFLKLV